MKTTSNKQFICFRERPSASRKIICFPPAGSGASFYSKWHQRLTDDIEVWALQLPHREFLGQQDLPWSISHLLHSITSEIVEVIDNKTSFYGHSFGAALAFFTTLWLEKNTYPLNNLIISARKPIPARYNPLISQLDDESLIDYVKSLGGGNHPLLEDKERKQKFLTLLRHDLHLNENVDRYCSPINTPITCLYADSDIALSKGEAQAWKIMTNTQFTFHHVNGDHFFVNNSNHCCYTIINEILMKNFNYGTSIHYEEQGII